MPVKPAWRLAQWSAADRVLAGTTTRHGGSSVDPLLASNNMSLRVGDVLQHVQANRLALRHDLQRALQPPEAVSESSLHLQWLDQVHGSHCRYIGAAAAQQGHSPEADAMWTDQAGIALVVQSADCVPVVMANNSGEVIGAAHAGWRGLLDNVLAQLVLAMPVPSAQLLAWVGPCIGAGRFEVGADVWPLLLEDYSGTVTAHARDPAKRMVDLARVAELQLRRSGVGQVSQSGFCTYSHDDFYSHRRAT
ncbi:MAG: hypothetical protein GWP70_08615, partial [Proteobacteria bacterium]|nr:hypothetical protein [Pseudomonadota bacterium]